MIPLSDHLRVATRRQHTALDRGLLASEAFRQVERYVWFLCGMHGFHRDVERRLAGHPLTEASGHRVRSPSAAADLRRLADLGVEVPVDHCGDDTPDELDGSADHRSGGAADPAMIAGMLYVVEGSSLGGLHLARLVRRHLPDVSGALSFLEGVGEQTRPRWECTTSVIDRSGVDRDRAAAAASDTFHLAGAWLDLSLDVRIDGANVEEASR